MYIHSTILVMNILGITIVFKRTKFQIMSNKIMLPGLQKDIAKAFWFSNISTNDVFFHKSCTERSFGVRVENIYILDCLRILRYITLCRSTRSPCCQPRPTFDLNPSCTSPNQQPTERNSCIGDHERQFVTKVKCLLLPINVL